MILKGKNWLMPLFEYFATVLLNFHPMFHFALVRVDALGLIQPPTLLPHNDKVYRQLHGHQGCCSCSIRTVLLL